MDQLERKAWLIGELLSGRYRSSVEALDALKETFSALAPIPSELRDQPAQICTDLTSGRITDGESVMKLVDFVETIPHEL
jgi:hypothetical protein